MMNEESKRSVTIEDLLRLKRAERPTAESWEAFDRELRAKQLAAIVEKRPWWRRLPQRLGGLARLHLPIGATAVLAITLISIRDYQPVSSTQNAGSTDVILPGAPVASQTPGDVVQPAVEVAPAPVVLSSEATSPGQLARMVPLLTTGDGAMEAAERPSARSIAENRAVAEAMFGTPSSSFESRALPASAATRDPLAQMPNPAETRRSRFAVAFAAAAATANAQTASAARTARRISDEELYDSVRRFGASGNTVSFKF